MKMRLRQTHPARNHHAKAAPAFVISKAGNSLPLVSGRASLEPTAEAAVASCLYLAGMRSNLPEVSV